MFNISANSVNSFHIGAASLVKGFYPRQRLHRKQKVSYCIKIRKQYAFLSDVERLFSKAGDILTNDRNRLNPENAEKILFCKENMPHVNFKY